MKKNNAYNGIDREDFSNGRLNPLQIVWLAYTLVYVFLAIRRNHEVAIFGYVGISDVAMAVLTAIAVIFSVGMLIYNKKHEEFESVKQFGYLMVVCTLLGLTFFLMDVYF